MNIAELIIGVAGVVAGVKNIKRGFGEVTKASREISRVVMDTPYKTEVHEVRNVTERVGHIANMVRRWRNDPRVREFAVKAVSQKCGNHWCVAEKDYLGELKAIYDVVRANVRYVRDTYGRDLFQSPVRTLQFGGEDCFPAGTLMLAEGHNLVPVERLVSGMKIWGLDRWSTVENVWYKGVLPVHAIILNNGSTMKLTGDHHVYILDCERHPIDRESGPCSCSIDERIEKRIRVDELREGMVLPTPKRIPFGLQKMDPDRAYIEGLYISDGFSRNTDFSISGKDGCPKEAQKKEVQEICARLGLKSTWHPKYISVLDKEWALRMHMMGRRAPEKHVLTIDLDEGAAGALLRGIMADSGENRGGCGRTFTTTSRQLALQTRLLHKMFGMTCGERYIVDHGGLGENPIWRLSTRDRHDGKHEKLLRVKAIEPDVMSLPAWDITTDDHRVYLPEADVTVSQCDGFSILCASLVQAIGYPVRLRVIRTRGADDWNHIYCMIGIPPRGPQKWVPMDASVPYGMNWQAPEKMIAQKKDFQIS